VDDAFAPLKMRSARISLKLFRLLQSGVSAQLIPSFIPVIGFLDDVPVLFLGVKLLQRITPTDVVAECRQLAEATETRRNEKIESAAGAAASIAIVLLWLLATVTAGALLVKTLPSLTLGR